MSCHLILLLLHLPALSPPFPFPEHHHPFRLHLLARLLPLLRLAHRDYLVRRARHRFLIVDLNRQTHDLQTLHLHPDPITTR